MSDTSTTTPVDSAPVVVTPPVDAAPVTVTPPTDVAPISADAPFEDLEATPTTDADNITTQVTEPTL